MVFPIVTFVWATRNQDSMVHGKYVQSGMGSPENARKSPWKAE